jgi:hypothetical protein
MLPESARHSVDITIYDARPEVRELVEKLAAKFQYGHFDGMHDLYEYSNTNEALPQIKFVHVRNEVSAETRQRVYDFVRGYYGGGDTLPERNDDAGNSLLCGEWAHTLVHREFSRSDSAYWTRAPQKQPDNS